MRAANRLRLSAATGQAGTWLCSSAAKWAISRARSWLAACSRTRRVARASSLSRERGRMVAVCVRPRWDDVAAKGDRLIIGSSLRQTGRDHFGEIAGLCVRGPNGDESPSRPARTHRRPRSAATVAREEHSDAGAPRALEHLAHAAGDLGARGDLADHTDPHVVND